ncbi:iron-containing alcohol dehydrogenase family protein [Lactococcus sp.]|uniref:iron-containing alcohol dehydrogenase family protein n=1 Tax=Lactococcus sp. TaxID=44273 RepID=UPI0035AF4518
MKISLEVRPGPNRYVSKAGAVHELEAYVEDFKRVAVITGEKSFAVFSDYYGKKLPYPVYFYNGTASYADAKRLSELTGGLDLIIAIGGGKVADTAKLTAELLDCELLILPTLVSNCAPYTPVVAVYDEQHQFVEVAYAKRAAYLTLVDPEFLLRTPKAYLVAGIGDTIAKWYEMEAIVRQMDLADLPATARLGFTSAKEIMQLLQENAVASIEALDSQELTPAYAKIVDTVIALSGTVGGFAAQYGRTSGAHALHDGMSVLTETHEILHGHKVAYSVLVMLAYGHDLAEIDHLIPFYQACGLPISLADMDLAGFELEKWRPVAEFAAGKGRGYDLVDAEVSADKILTAIQEFEAINK